jgi:hypothetical protein
MDGLFLVPDEEAPALGEPGQRPFSHPAPARSSGRRSPAFPRRYAGEAAGRDRSPRSHAQSDGHRPCPGRDAAPAPWWAGDAPRRWPPEWRRGAWSRGRWLPRSWPPRAPQRLPPRGAVSPLVAAVGGGAAHQGAAPPGVAPGGGGGWPRPVHPAQLIAGLDQHGPEALHEAAVAPLLDMARDGTVIAQAPGEVMPWAAGAPPEADAGQYPAQRHAAMPLGLGGAALMANRLAQ